MRCYINVSGACRLLSVLFVSARDLGACACARARIHTVVLIMQRVGLRRTDRHVPLALNIDGCMCVCVCMYVIVCVRARA